MRKIEKEASVAMRAGFTLMEILVAVAIIGILGTAAVQGITGYIDKARKTTAKESCDNIKNACTTYHMNKGKWPNDLKVLTEEHGDEEAILPGGEDILNDPWGTAYKYERKGSKVVIISAGPDGQFGNEDDLRSDRKLNATSKED